MVFPLLQLYFPPGLRDMFGSVLAEITTTTIISSDRRSRQGCVFWRTHFFYDYQQFPILHPLCYSRFAISNRLAQSAHLSQHRGVTSGSKEVTGTAPSPP